MKLQGLMVAMQIVGVFAADHYRLMGDKCSMNIIFGFMVVLLIMQCIAGYRFLKSVGN